MKGFFNILKWIIILILVFFVLFQLLFDKTPEEARGQLAKLNIKFNEASFLDRVMNGDAHAVHLFLQAGMDPNVADEKRKTALIHAAEKGRTNVAKLLLDSGAIINAQDKIFGGTPLLWGAFNGHADTTKLLLNSGADPKAVNFKGQTSLYKAAEGGNAAVVGQILDQGGNPNAKSNDGLTPLHAAALIGNREAAKLLIDKGAKVSGQGANGDTDFQLLGKWVNYNNPHDVVEFRIDKSFIYEMDGGKTINSGKGQIKLKTITWATGNNVDLVGTLKNDTLILEINGKKNTYRRKK